MFKNALVSVSDKTGLIEFLKPLAAQGMRVVSTGGTAKFLKESGLAVVDISEQTKFPEILDGRVKTLHPNVHMALLAKQDLSEHMNTIQQYGIQPFDLVVGNLYPFENALMSGQTGDELIEQIDIGGPSFLRSGAKNFKTVAVFCDPNDYQLIQGKSELTFEDRKYLAAKVFSHVSTYDSMISKELCANWGPYYSLGGEQVQKLRYGENPHQEASWYKIRGSKTGLHQAQIIQGKELSYNNILDLESATSLVRALKKNSVVAVKHNNPCGVGSGSRIEEALAKCLKADPVSVFGGIVALNSKLTNECAEKLNEIFLECIIAPEIEEGAKLIFQKKKNVRVLEWPSMNQAESSSEIKTVSGGFVIQTTDIYPEAISSWKFLGDIPSDQQLLDLVFAEKVSASLKSNAIALVSNLMTVGLGMGQVNRVEAVQHAIERWKKHHPNEKNVVVASDAFFPFADSIEVLASAGVKWILQPGGSVNDEKVIQSAKDHNINMVLTGRRHFRH